LHRYLREYQVGGAKGEDRLVRAMPPARLLPDVSALPELLTHDAMLVTTESV